MRQRLCFWAGPLAAALIAFALPIDALSDAGRATLALMAWMALWWISEAVDLHATALLPLVVLPLADASTFGQAAAPYAERIVFLFLGGFLLAQAMQRWELDRRFALRTLERVGTKPTRILLGLMLATGAISAFVSNTATAAMMLPIALGVVRWAEQARESRATITEREFGDFRVALMLGVAYAATIGGFTTLVGSPPNGILAQFCRTSLGRELDFASWLWVGVPCAFVLLPAAWWLLAHRLFRLPRVELGAGAASLREELAAMGPLGPAARRTIAVFAATVGLWLFQPLLPAGIARLGDAGVAIAAGIALFAVPSGGADGSALLRWRDAERIPWGVLILFGGGLSLAAAVERNGVADLLGRAAQGLDGLPPLLLIFLVATAVSFLTELASNVAVTATLLPILAAMAPGLGVDEETLILPATLAASCAFMMPAGTPPNAIVFASGHLTIPQMARAGFWLNWISVVVISLVVGAMAGRGFVIR
ncbi:MAG: DASS family sodium-coupled anion symporter [Planctomycetes bacterium]|nr:DASS family sodium-coupled anion symporter [Planctomycetota bacterium]